MVASNKQLTVLSDAERAAFYELPDFDNEQRFKYLTLTDGELCIALSRKALSAKVYCILQIGYFKAVQLFFHATWDQLDSDDIDFVLQQYFSDQSLNKEVISRHEYYSQCTAIAKLFEYRIWNQNDVVLLYNYAPMIIRCDIKPQFIALELLDYLRNQRIIRPGYTTLQSVVSDIINIELKRLSTIINDSLTKDEQMALQALVTNDNTLSRLALLKQDAKDFRTRMMAAECEKLNTLHPFYLIMVRLLPLFQLSQQNIFYYSSLVNYYTSYDLREKIKTKQTYLYLLCYAWQRYQQINDNLINAFCHHIKQFSDEIRKCSNIDFEQHIVSKHEALNAMKALVQLYIDDTLSDDLSFGDVRKKAFAIIAKDQLAITLFNQFSPQKNDFYWQKVDKIASRITLNLRPLATVLKFSSTDKYNQWLQAQSWMIGIFAKQQRLTNKLDDCPEDTIPNRLKNYLIVTDDNKNQQLNSSRYEFWIYKQLNQQFQDGYIFLNDSLKYRALEQELVSIEKTKELATQLKIPAFTAPITHQLDTLFATLDQLWRKFNKLLRSNKIKHLRYDEKTRTLHSQKPKANKEEELQHRFYEQLPLCDITDVLRFVDNDCEFLSAFTHIQPRYSKQPINKDHLMATIIAQAMNNGNLNMSAISDIPYKSLQDTLESRVRLATLQTANDIISNAIAKMPIFSTYSIDMDVLYGGVDGQKFEVDTPTIKARYSKKYFRKGKGVVAYTMLANHIPLQVELIGANEHESYFVFDIWHNNTTEIVPDVITGDMHCINKANFAIMHWFGSKLSPRFTNMEDQRNRIYSGCSPSEYKNFIIQPVAQLNRELIESEWLHLQQIIATLALKETTQSTIIRKLCTYSPEHKTRKALFEFDNLIRSIFTLNYFINPDIQRKTHQSQNRVEAYHQLRAAIAQAYGKKQLIGRTDIAIEISNQCGRLIANAISYYNSAILSKLLLKYQAEGNQKALSMLSKISPIAKQHIHFQGHLTFTNENIIDLDEIVKQLILN